MATEKIQINAQTMREAGELFWSDVSLYRGIVTALSHEIGCVFRALRQIAAMNLASMEGVKARVGTSEPTFSGHFHSMAGIAGRGRTWPFRPNVSKRKTYAVNHQQPMCPQS